VAGSIVKAALGSRASKKAASQQAAAAAESTRQEREQYDLTRGDILDQQKQVRADYLPFLQTGQASNQELARLLGVGGDAGSEGYGSLAKPFTMADYEADPGYRFRLEEGQKAIDRATSAKGRYFSGQRVKGLTDYSQDAASQEYANAYNRYRQNQSDLYSRLTGVSEAGRGAAGGVATSGGQAQGQLANVGQGTSGRVGQNIVGAGNARAAGTIGSAQSYLGGISDIEDKALRAAGMATGLTPAGGR
jgi:hypothetical protein